MIKLKLEVITPIKVIYSDEVDQLTLTTQNGEISILPNHINLITKVLPGEMVIKNGSKTELFAITGGFLEISNNQVSILSDHAVRATDIELTKAKEAKERAEKAMKDKQNNKEFVIAEAELRKALLELKVATKHRSRPQ